MENLHKILNIFKYFIGLLYIALGIFLLSKPEQFQHIVDNLNNVRIVGGVMTFYGLFRLYRAYKIQTASRK